MEKLKNQIVMTVYVLLGMAGILFSFSDAFQIAYDKAEVCVAAGIFCILITIVLNGKSKWRKCTAIGLVFASCGIMAVLYENRLWESLNAIISRMSGLVEEYLGIVSFGVNHVEIEQAEPGILFLLFIVAGLFAYSVVCMKRAWAAMLLLGIGFFMPFFVGEKLSNLSVILIVSAILGILSYKSGLCLSGEESEKRKTGFVSIGIGMAAILFGMAFFAPRLQPFFQNRETLKSNVDYFWEHSVMDKFAGKGGVSSGTIGGIGRFGKDDSKHLKLTAKEQPSVPIYLKGYIGTEYQENKWKKSDADAFQKWAAVEKTSAQEILNPNVPEELEEASKTKLHIENIGANPKYYYIPYGGFYGENMDVYGDTYIRGKWEKNYDVTYFPMYFYMMQQEPDMNSDKESAYYEYVKEMYCDVPEHIEKAFREVVDEKIPDGDVGSIMNAIAYLLDRQAEYRLNPGRTPSGKDVAEYFYFENKKGYCEHFATTAVLMFRMKGIPARYVAGYRADEKDFHKNEAGEYEFVVTGDSAHAWAEIYVQGIGWVPAETTPSYTTVGEAPRENMSEEEEPRETVPQEMPQENKEDPVENKQEESQKQQLEKPEDEENQKQFWGWGVFFLVMMLVTIVVCRGIWVQKKYKEEKQMDANERTKTLFRRIAEVLVLAKVVEKEDEVNEAWIQKLCSAYPEIDETEAGQMLEIIYRANFGNEKIQKEEYQICRKIYRQIKAELSKNISLWRKIWWKYWRGIFL